MFQGHGRVLKGRVEIRLGKMPGVACFREEAKISKAKPPDQVDHLLKIAHIRLLFIRGMDEHAPQENGLNSDVKKKEAGFSHRGQSSLFTTSALMS
jgi:hypothetical protein